ncbi:MAG TPA: polysaccharide biosynthesis/export family protein [Stellaceae bacterium]|nr:polysaccharide biosynthesis/export family protein [Stellaceae bacterium]
MKLLATLGCLAGAALVGCAALPTAGPSAKEVVKQEIVRHRRRFDLVDIDRQVVGVLSARPRASFYERFSGYGKPPPATIGIGDALAVTLWEGAAGGLFATSDPPPGGSQSVAIPVQVVGPDGGISVPYAGRVPVAGRLPVEVQHEIERRLGGKAIEPQAIVTLAKSVTDSATVSGEVVSGARLPLSLNGERLLDLIAAAGGAKSPVYDTFVRLSRGGVTVTIPMERLVSHPAENIYAWPGDVLTLVRVPQSFTAFGATGRNAEVEFEARRLSLIKAIAKAGGLVDQRADPEGVFLFRYEPAAIVEALHTRNLETGPGGSSPVVYRLDMRDADAYFLAQRFRIENNDVLYVANAPLTDLQKFFTLLNTLTGPVITGIVVNKSAP